MGAMIDGLYWIRGYEAVYSPSSIAKRFAVQRHIFDQKLQPSLYYLNE